jgi:hypothetical protein
VNCGYDTDCTGATVGSILGIIAGTAGLPAKWTAPLGNAIATNESWGGLRNISKGPNPVPKTLEELTARVIKVAEKVLASNGLELSEGIEISQDDLVADSSIHDFWRYRDQVAKFAMGNLAVTIDYHDTPAVIPNNYKAIAFEIANTGEETVEVDVKIAPPHRRPPLSESVRPQLSA